MTRRRNLTTTLTATAAAGLAAAALAGCGGGGGVSATAAGSPPRPAAGSATLALASTGLGRVLVNAQGRTLYLFKADHGSTSACTGACATNWPPLRASGKPKVGTGLQASAATTIERSDGNPQVAYHGHPLYTYVGDQKPGDTTGQGSNGFGAGWFAVTASGAQASGSASGSGSAGAYGGTPPAAPGQSALMAAEDSSAASGQGLSVSVKRLTLVATILGSSIAILDSSVVSVALPSIQRSLGGGLAGQQWVSNAYLLTLGSFILLGGSLGDIFGQRRMFALGVGGFGLSSVLCAIAPSIGGADRLLGAAGCRGRAAHAELVGRDHRHLPREGARSGDRDLEGLGNDRRGAWSADRGIDSERRDVALDLRDQRATRECLPVADREGRAREGANGTGASR